MLQTDDEFLVQQDSALPALRILLNDTAATIAFQKSFPHLNVQRAACSYLRYKPGTSCIASYSLATAQGECLAHAIAHRSDADDKLAKAGESASRGPGFSSVLKTQHLVLSIYPHDDDLPSLRLLADDAQRSFLQRLAPSLPDRVRVTSLRYKPRRRFVGRIDVDGSPHSILKLHSPADYQQARRAAKSLHALPNFTTAPILGHSDRHCAVLLGWLSGQSLASQWDRPASELCAALREAGKLLAVLHGQGPLKLPTTSPEAQLAALSLLPAELAALSPQIADQTCDLVTNALSLYGRLDRPITSLHGDLSPDQILIGDRVALIDFDNAALGSAEQDLGTFLAHLEKAGCDGRLDSTAALCLFDELLTAYRSAGGQVDTSALQVYAVVGILKLIQEPFRLRMPTWLRHSLKLVERAAARLGESSPTRQRVSRCTNSGPFADDLALRATHPALDLSSARQALTPLLCEAYRDPSLEICDSRLLRHKPGRRCIIEYTCVSGQRKQQFRVLGKAYAKPRHRQAYRLQRALWNQGFHHDTADKISVSHPLSVVDQWHMWLQEAVEGVDLWKALAGSDSQLVIDRLVASVSKLQNCALCLDREHSINDELAHLKIGLQKTAHEMPHLRSRLEELHHRCEDLGQSIAAEPSVPTHRDFYPDQVLIAGDSLCIIDWDLLCLSHPALDMGNFCGHLLERAIRDPAERDRLRKRVDDFRAHYFDSGREALWQSIEAYATLTLVRHVFLCTQFADRSSFLPNILMECERRLDLHGQEHSQTMFQR